MVPDYCGSHGRCSSMRQAQKADVVLHDENGWFIITKDDRIEIVNCPWCGWQLPKGSRTRNIEAGPHLLR